MATDDDTRVAAPPTAAPPTGWGDPATIVVPGASQRRFLPLVVWMGCLVVALGLLLALGNGRLAAPALTQPATWSAWGAGREPVEVVVVALRVLALGLAWYLAGITSISVVARVLRAARLVRLADALSFGPVRVIAQQAVGVSLAAGILATAVPGVAVTGSSVSSADTRVAVAVPIAQGDVVTAVPLPGEAAAVTTARFGGVSEALVPEASSIAEAGQVEVMAPIPGPTVSTEDAAFEAAPDAPSAGVALAREVRVAPGDHLWSLAEADVQRHLGRPATEQEVAAHWEDVVAANADRLQVPGNPDLLLPGQLVVLPLVAGGGA